MSRRDFLLDGGRTTVALTAAGAALGAPATSRGVPRHELPPLPYPDDALAPAISSRTVGVHYGKHHRGYIENTNALVAGTPLADLSLSELVQHTAGDPAQTKLFNNAAQAWNHAFYWRSLTPRGGAPAGALATRIDADFGSFEALLAELSAAATGQFGSGWAWLVLALLIGSSLVLLGAGGSIVTVPVLVYAAGLDPHRAAGTSLVIVGLVALAGAIARWRVVSVRTGLLFGALGMIATSPGVWLNHLAPGAVVLAGFALTMLVVAARMIRPVKVPSRSSLARERILPVLASALAVGLMTGFFGVGGGFLIVPALSLVLGLEMAKQSRRRSS